MKLGFIGFGEAGYSIAKGLKEEGLQDIIAYDIALADQKYSKLLKERAEESNVALVNEIDDIFRSDIIYSALPANKALGLVEKTIDKIQKNQLYVDVSAARPSDKKKMEKLVSGKEALFVDGAMIGRLVVDRHRVPILASGSGVDQFIDKMSIFDMNITRVSSNAGDSTSIKLIRSIFMKGYAALCMEMLEASKKLNVENLIIEGISHTLDNKTFEETANKLVTGTSIHAERRTVELEGSIDLLNELEVNSIMTNAVSDKLKHITAYGLKEDFNAQPPGNWAEVINAIIAKEKEY